MIGSPIITKNIAEVNCHIHMQCAKVKNALKSIFFMQDACIIGFTYIIPELTGKCGSLTYCVQSKLPAYIEFVQ
jgi:hypothetical protein